MEVQSTVTAQLNWRDLFRIVGQANVDFFGVADGASRICWQPDETTTVWIRLDQDSTELIRKKNLELKALLDEAVSLTGIVERKAVFTDVTLTTTRKQWVDQNV